MKISVPQSVASSLTLYEKAKQFFIGSSQKNFVVQMSEHPISQWTPIPVSSLDEMMSIRSNLREQKKYFCGIARFEDQPHFYFFDGIVLISQNLNSGKFVHFEDFTFQELNLQQVSAELRQLQGS